jgi:hypothetical protein
MTKLNLNEIVKNAKTVVVEHSPAILTGIGITGMITTTVLAVKATPKALDIIADIKERHENDTDRKVVAKELVTKVAPVYIPAVVTGVASAACIIGANSIHTKRNAMLAAAYTISDTALREYRGKVVETMGEKKDKAIKDEIAKDKLREDPVQNHEVIVTKSGTTLCYDCIFGRYFRSDMETIKRAITKINRILVTDMYVSLNDFYCEIDIPPVKIGDDIGWNIDDGILDVDFSSQLAEDGTPCLVIGYTAAPKYGFSKFL